MRIAFTTEDSVHINAHFGSASKIDIYDVNAETYNFAETINFSGNLTEDGNEDKLEPKLKALKGCTIIYVSAIGGSAAARLIGKNITPIKSRTDDAKIEDILSELVKTLSGNPPPWLRKALLKDKAPAFEVDEEALEEEEEVMV